MSLVLPGNPGGHVGWAQKSWEIRLGHQGDIGHIGEGTKGDWLGAGGLYVGKEVPELLSLGGWKLNCPFICPRLMSSGDICTKTDNAGACS